MEIALAALGASSVLALLILGRQDDEPFREQWESKHGKQLALSRLPPVGQVVPFKLIQENPVIPIMLDGDEHLTCWIVDSGYGFTAIDSKLATRLKLKKKGRMSVQTLQTDSLDSADLPSGFIFNFLNDQPIVEFPRHSGVIRPLPGTLEKTWGRGTLNDAWGKHPRCAKSGGILGITFLRHFVTRIDYRQQTMTFFDPDRFTYSGPGQKHTGFLPVEHYFLIPMTVNGVTANMALDTGAFATIMTKGFLSKYKKQTGKNLDVGGTSGSVEASFSESVIKLKRKIIPKIEINSSLFYDTAILFPDCNDDIVCPGLLATNRFDGLMGYSMLKHFVIYLVYEPTPYVILETQ